MSPSKGKVFIQGPGGFPYRMMFARAGYTGARSITEADIVCFTGGEDVDPDLYNDAPHPATRYNEERDRLDCLAYGEAEKYDKLIVGICRGAQFLNVMNGGGLWQHVDKHATYKGHEIWVPDLNWETFTVSSTHHQMMRPPVTGQILGLCFDSTTKEGGSRKWTRAEHDAKIAANPKANNEDPNAEDAEIVWFSDTRCLCFQPHPEMDGFPECTSLFFQLLEEKRAA